MKTKINLNYVPLAMAFIFALLAFIVPHPAAKFKVDTKASTLTWVGKKITGQHAGAVPISTGELVSDGKLLKEGSFEIDVNALTVSDEERIYLIFGFPFSFRAEINWQQNLWSCGYKKTVWCFNCILQ